MSILKLEMYVSSLPQKDQDFAQSLIEQSKKRQLSPKQLCWVEKLAGLATHVALAEKAIDVIIPAPISVPGVITLIRTNNNAKRPKIRFLVGDAEFTLSVASAKARFPGTVNVNSNGQWFGRIHTDGRYEVSSRINETNQQSVIAALHLVASHPAEMAAAYGKKTGRCCFCALHLTDARSLDVGYGAICAKHYRLPWDVTKLQKVLFVKELTDKQAFGL